jgi:hypothetical protein
MMYFISDCNKCAVTVWNFIAIKRNNQHIVKDLINALPGNSSVNTVQVATIQESVFSVDSTDAPIDWLDSDHVICVYCRTLSVPQLYK